MKAVGYKTPSPIDAPESLLDIELAEPAPEEHDLLVEVKAVSVNPVDVKVRAGSAPAGAEYNVLGWDAAGVVKTIGSEVSMFKAGDEVFYAGTLSRPGSNAELHLVDERIVGHKSKTLSFAQAAALPLTSLTAWELLFDRLASGHKEDFDSGTLLIIGGAGGVGSMMIQFARQLTGLTIIATASRPETKEWCLDLGAHHVVDHSIPLPDQLKSIGIPEVGLIVSLTATEAHYPALIEVLAPQGKLGVIDDPKTLDAKPLKRKSASQHWELMFTRSLYGTTDMVNQNHILNQVSQMVDAGSIRTTLTETFGPINAENLKKAHALIRSQIWRSAR